MDNKKIHDSGFEYIGQSLTALLTRRLKEKSLQNFKPCNSAQKPKNKVSRGYPTGARKRMVLPTFSFQFQSYKIRDSSVVEYDVKMWEQYVVLGRTVRQCHNFQTRYSMLEKLSEKVGQKGFPPKKIFGNTKDSFIKERMGLLETYLNGCGKRVGKEFLRFLKQIKECSFKSQMKKEFKL